MAPRETNQEEGWQIFEFDAPTQDESELEILTHRIMGLKDSTRRDVLAALRHQKRMHPELENLLGRNPGAIHRALTNLLDDGLLLQQVSARAKPVVRSYSLTPKGHYALDLMQRYQRASDDRPVEVRTKAGTYILYSREPAGTDMNKRIYFFAKKGQKPTNARPENVLPSNRLRLTNLEEPILE